MAAERIAGISCSGRSFLLREKRPEEASERDAARSLGVESSLPSLVESELFFTPPA